MRERLPSITIKPDIYPREFLGRLHSLIPKQNIWKITNLEEVHKNFVILGLYYQGHKPKIPKDLTAHFIHNTKLYKGRIGVNVSATNWIEGLTYDSYVDAANLLKSILLIYNRRYKARVRLNIESRKNLLPKLSPELRKFFDRFASGANKTALHPSDWSLFYDLVGASHILRSKLTEDDIAYLLVREGFEERQAQHLAEIYGHGRHILRKHKNPILAQAYLDIFWKHQTTDSQNLP